MKTTDVLRAWGSILSGRRPALSIEITRECPLRCPGCYAYEEEHLGEAGPLRSLADFKGDALVEGVLKLVRQEHPLHVSIVGGEPLVRFRELTIILPRLSAMGINVQLVTSAVRSLPIEWASIKNLSLVVSIDGLQADHDHRRQPATYERILTNIQGQQITVHSTITRQMTERAGYFAEFLQFWSARPEIRRVWFSLFTPQIGAAPAELLPATVRTRVLDELLALRPAFPKLDLPESVVAGYRQPPSAPTECLFALNTANYSADLQTRITPCQFGGTPDCSQCGCMASAGLNAVGAHRLGGLVPLASIYKASVAIGTVVKQVAGRQ